MPENTGAKIYTDETGHENARHGVDGFPFEYYLEDVYDFALHCIDWHWHDELEFAYVRSGRVKCFAGGQEIVLTPGMGIFLSSRLLHRFTAEGSAVMPNMVFSPALLAGEGSPVYEKYIRPAVERGAPFAVLDEKNGCAELISRFFDMQDRGECTELTVMQKLFELWEKLLPVISGAGEKREERSGNELRLQSMIQFIQEHYRNDIKLADIASSAYLSSSGAMQLFKKRLGVAPVAYLINYRLRLAADELKNTEKSTAMIAEETGFASSGYFCRRFRAQYGMTPGEYRRKR